ncbi:MAG: element excision factor XisI family protein [Chloroflexota bacterium]
MVGVAHPHLELTELETITRREVDQYTGNSFTSKSYFIADDQQKLYAAISVPNFPRPWPTRIAVMAQVVGDKVIIIEDNTDKPLVDALMVNGGVPREQIILAYAGEPIPTQ